MVASVSTPSAGGYGVPSPAKSSILLTAQGSGDPHHPPGKANTMATPDWTVEKGHGCPASAPWAVVDTDSGEVYCCSRSEEAARAQAAVAWDSDAAGDAPDSGASKEGVVPGKRSLRSPPTDIHAGSRPRGADLGFLHNLTGGLQAVRDRAAAHEAVDSRVATLAKGITEGHSAHLDAAVSLAQKANVPGATGGTGSGVSAGSGGGGGHGNSAAVAAGGGAGRSLRAATGASDQMFLHDTTAGMRGINASIDAYEPHDSEIGGLAGRVSVDHEAYMGEISSLLTAGGLGGGSPDDTDAYMGGDGQANSAAVTGQARAAGKAPYGNVTYADPGYQSDNVKRYPLDSAAHCKAAWSYINMPKNAAKYSAGQVASIKGRIKAAAKKFGVAISSGRSDPATLDAGVIRSITYAQELRDAQPGSDSLGLLTGHFSVFDTWYKVDSAREGTFLERVDRSAFNDTIRDDQAKMRVLFDHGFDPQLGNKVLGPIRTLRPDDAGAYYEVDLFDTSYNRDLLPGLKAGVYGASMRMRVLDDKWDDKPASSDYNPDGIAERTIFKTSVGEFGPVTFPASPTATAGIRSMTDYFYERRGLLAPGHDSTPDGIRTLVEDGLTPDEAVKWVRHLDLTGRSDALSVDGGDPETGPSSGHGSTHIVSDSRSVHDHMRWLALRHPSAYRRDESQ